MPPQKKAGSLYSGVPIQKKKEKTKPKADPFISLTQTMNKFFKGMGRGAVYTDDQKSLMEFVGYEVSAEEYKTAQMGCIVLGFMVSAVLVVVGLILSGMTFESPMFLGPTLVGLIVPFMIYFMYSSMPASKAKTEKMLALGYMPEIVNYLIMSMRLTPNLEKAVEFAATHGRGKIAEDLKKIVWDVQIGKYLSVEEALDRLAYNWGAYNEDFKQALMVIRASVLEADTARREALLEKAIADVLEGSKEKMDLYARALHGPTVYLYYFGVLLPLMLAIVVPIGGSFLKKFPIPLNNPLVIGGVYIVALPILIFMMGKMILGGRPPTYEPPEIGEDFPGLPPKGILQFGKIKIPYLPIAILAFVAILAGAFYMDYTVNVAEINAGANYAQELAGKPHLEIPFIDWPWKFFGIISLFGAMIGASIAISISIVGKYYARKKIQDEIRGMETEFKDALYVLASRLGENRPIEDAMKQAVEFLPKSKLANRVFRRVLDNIRSMGMTLDEAVFNPTFGAVKDMPSKTIKSGMGILIDAVGLGVNVAAKSLIGLSMQLRNAERIDAMLRNLLSDVTSMLKTMGSFIAPIVLGVVTSLQGIIGSAIAGNPCPEADTTSAAASGPLGGGGGISGMLCTDPTAPKGTSPFEFTIIMGIYVIEVVILLTYFNAQVEDSNNKLHTYMAIAQALPIATTLFCIVAFFAGKAVATSG